MELGTFIVIAIIVYAFCGSKRKRQRTLYELKNSINATYENISLEAQKEYRDEEHKKKEDFEALVKNIEEKIVIRKKTSHHSRNEIMTHSVINIICRHCNKSLNGILHDLFNVEKDYCITCKKCNGQTIFKDPAAAIINAEIPKDVIEIMYVAKINNT